jgi:hypothetical protein
MIKTPLTKILFLDIETVGGCKDYETCKNEAIEFYKSKNIIKDENI